MISPKHISIDLQKRKSQNAFRILTHQQGIDFSSNDFLGLSQNKELLDIIKHKISNLTQLGSKGSRLLSGNTPLHVELEKYLATIVKAESTLLLNSGYSANLALLSSVAKKHSTIIYDEDAHASIKDGARLSLAKKLSFKHNNIESLAKKLAQSEGEKYVVVEAIYSMNGDFCMIEEIIAICKKYNAHLIVDEAHSTAIYGEKASGWIAEKGLENEVFARIFTFGKAIGNSGACIAGSSDLKNYLINFARPFIYTTAMSLFNVIAIKENFTFVIDNDYLKQQLFKNIAFFKSKIKTESITAIQPVFISGNDNVKKIAHNFTKNNLDIKPILSPTVPVGKELLRICLHSFNTENEIKNMTSLLC